jgi:hypothetical protein
VKRVDFCRLALWSGTDADHRSRAALSWELLESKATNYDDLKPEKRAVSDLETFSNPYTDSRNLPQQSRTKREGFSGAFTSKCRNASCRPVEGGAFADAGLYSLFPVGSRLYFVSAACPGYTTNTHSGP